MKLERVAIAVLLVVVAGQSIVGCLERRSRRAERITAANQLAASARQEDWLKGQLRVAVRYVHQGQVELDETQRERNQQAILAAAFRLEAQDLRGRVAATPTIAGDTATFSSEFGSLDSNGVHVETDLRVWPVPASPLYGDALYRVHLAPVPLTVGFACVGPNGRFYVTAPQSRPVTLDQGVVDEEVCNPPVPTWQPLSLRAPTASIAWAIALFGFGVYVGSR